MILNSGDVIGQYEISRRLGSGGMATVYLAHHPRLEREVAVKVLHDAFQQDDAFLIRFEREARIVAGLEHPHIVPIYDYSEHNGLPYLVMKYIKGRSLKLLLDENEITTITEALRLLEPIASALDYAHQSGILHRDVKPSNIVLDQDNIPYLADFGLARIALSGESTLSQDMILGTPQYISPEQAKGQRDIDGRADLYSLGIILYQILVGHVPFNADTPYAIIHDHIYTQLPAPTQVNQTIPRSIDDVLVKALAKDPTERFESGKEMMKAFRQASSQAQYEAIDVSSAALPQSITDEQRQQAITQAEEASIVKEKVDSRLRTTQKMIVSESIVTEYKYQLSWLWTVVGVLGFVISLGWTLNTLNIISQESLSLWVGMQSDQIMLRQEQIQVQLSPMPLSTAQTLTENGSDQAQDYLAAAAALWNADLTEDAITTVRSGSDTTMRRSDYFLAASYTASSQEAYASSIWLMALALDSAEQERNDDRLKTIRNIVGQRTFEIATSQGQILITDFETYADTLRSRPNDVIDMAAAWAFLSVDQPNEAEPYIIALDDRNTSLEAEYALLAGDYFAQIGDLNEAVDFWERLVDDEEYIPVWISDEVTQRLAL
jgi:serine/threonine protein kinase